MKINIKVVTRASKNEVIKEGDVYKVKVTCPPVDGEANERIIKLLSKEFNVPKSTVKIVSGQKSRNKVVEIER